MKSTMGMYLLEEKQFLRSLINKLQLLDPETKFITL